MIYLFHGNNFSDVRKKCDVFLDKLFAKKPNASFFEITPENFERARVEELISGRGLFENEHVVLLKEIFELPDAENFILKHIQLFADSSNVFIFLERKMKKGVETALIKHAVRVWKLDDKKKAVKKDFNVFLLADAFGGRDKKRAWVLFCRALKEGIAPENVHGILFWQIKNMLLVSLAEGKNPGLSPFVFQKTKRALQHYSQDELKGFSSDLVSLYHDARRGIHDMGIALEQFILKI